MASFGFELFLFVCHDNKAKMAALTFNSVSDVPLVTGVTHGMLQGSFYLMLLITLQEGQLYSEHDQNTDKFGHSLTQPKPPLLNISIGIYYGQSVNEKCKYVLSLSCSCPPVISNSE